MTAKLPKNDAKLRERVEAAYWEALDSATSAADGEARLRRLVTDRFPGEISCLSLCWAVLDLFIASARGLGLTALEHRQLAQMRAARMAETPTTLTA